MTAQGAVPLTAAAAGEHAAARQLWIFSPATDLLAFTAPALLSLGAVALAPSLGLADPSPDWLWIAVVLCVDVAHVWSTAFVTYFDPAERARRPWRYLLVPGLGWVLGVAAYGLGGPGWFWRALAYLAVFHFVRQQYGWFALYRARAGDPSRLGAWIDGLAIYAATLYPLVWWHAHLPRRFDWFVPGDFASGVTPAIADACGALYALALAAYALWAVLRLLAGGPTPWGKHALLATTAATWFVGIVATDSDLAFMLTNVLAHGIPYAVLVFAYARHRHAAAPHSRDASRTGLAHLLLRGPAWRAAARFAACILLLAFAEELLWDRAVWHERPELFGSSFDIGALEPLIVPLLALPQLTHYVLDGLFWRRGDNPALRAWLSSRAAPRPALAPSAAPRQLDSATRAID